MFRRPGQGVCPPPVRMRRKGLHCAFLCAAGFGRRRPSEKPPLPRFPKGRRFGIILPSFFRGCFIMDNWPLPDFERKICPPEQLAPRIAALPRPLVLTNGCFDILHRGHVTYLAQARATGAALVLALNTDASVRRLGKGGDRPVNPLADRAAVAAALASVDLVTWFDEDTPAALVEAVRPDVLVKGGDWPADKIVGAAETLARGGKVYSIPFLHQTSTTQTLAKIRAGGAQTP